MAVDHGAHELAIERCALERAQPFEGLVVIALGANELLRREGPFSSRATHGPGLTVELDPILATLCQALHQGIQVDVVFLRIRSNLIVCFLVIRHHLSAEVLHALGVALRLRQFSRFYFLQVRLMDE